MTPTHEAILTAIDAARLPEAIGNELAAAVAEHCDDLRATAELHAPIPYGHSGLNYCRPCDGDQGTWPCPTVQVVIARLQSWGYLTERTEP